jgi:hypothetical protein
MFKTFDKQAFSLAVVVTVATVAGLGTLADQQYGQAQQWVTAQADIAAAAPAAQQVVVTGHRVQQVVITGQRQRG